MMQFATDSDVLRVPSDVAVALMERAVHAHGSGDLSSPVRHQVGVDNGGFVFTVGSLPGVANGFRVGSSIAETATEINLVFRPDGAPVGVVHGREIGRRRTGALGGVAAKLLSRADSHVVGLIGAGEQAFTQLWAIAAVRELRTVRVYSRNTDTAVRFAQRALTELGLQVDVVATAREAVTAADIVVMSTPAARPLIDASWIAPGTHVHTLGQKGPDEGECPVTLMRASDLLASDSPDQLAATEGPDQPWTQGRPVASLGEILLGKHRGRTSPDDITLFASTGLSGTEVLLADHVLSTKYAG